MKTISFLICNFGISSKMVATVIPYVLAFLLSTPASAFHTPQETVRDQETVEINEVKDSAVSPTPVYLDEDLLPEMTMTFAMGKNGEVLFVSSYGRRKCEDKGRSSNKKRKLLIDDMPSSN